MTRCRIVVGIAVLLAMAGCGGGDNKPSGVTFVGTVTSVTPQQAMLERPSRRWLASSDAFSSEDAIT